MKVHTRVHPHGGKCRISSDLNDLIRDQENRKKEELNSKEVVKVVMCDD